jgi:hypothetical protein
MKSRGSSPIFALPIAILASLHTGYSADPEDLPLPQWSAEEIVLPEAKATDYRSEFRLGGHLWPEGFTPEAEGGVPPDPNKDELLFFIPRTGKTSPIVRSVPKPQTQPATPLRDLSQEVLSLCETAEPDGYLIDPRTLLHEVQAEDLRRLLSYHTGESKVTTYYLLLDKDEKLPTGADIGKLAAGKLAKGHTCLVVYPMEEPWRVRFFMSRDITDSVSSKYLGEILHACVQDALQASDGVEQIQRFATQLSIRLIWLERAYPTVFAAAPATELEVKLGPAEQWLPEVTPEVVIAPATQTFLPEGWERAAVLLAVSVAGLAVGLLLMILGLRAWRRRERHVVWILPEVEPVTRLGGPHCGGGGASIRYS